MKRKQFKIRIILPILFCFFVMGFVDVAGIAVSYVKSDFGLSDVVSNILPAMTFLWFAVCSIPVSPLMRHIGRKRTVMLSAAITAVAMLVPAAGYSFPTMLLAFALLGIGNTVLQVSLNPFLAQNVPDAHVTGMLTFGQFVKAVSSSLGPVLVGLCASYLGSWRAVFYIYAALSALSLVWLCSVDAERERYDSAIPTGFGAIAGLLKDGYILGLFTVIVLIVGFEVGLMTAVPKFFAERFALPLEVGGWGCTLYFMARTAGTLIGALLLSKVDIRRFFGVTAALGVLSLAVFAFAPAEWVLFVSLFCVGLFCANVFAIVFGESLRYRRESANELSALMIVGVGGGALFPPVMGLIADRFSQQTSLAVPLVSLLYILFFAIFKMHGTRQTD